MKTRIFLVAVLVTIFLFAIRISLNSMDTAYLDWEYLLDGFFVVSLSFSMVFTLLYSKYRWIPIKKEQPPMGCRTVWNIAVFGIAISTWWAIVSSSINISAQENAGFLMVSNCGLLIGFYVAIIIKERHYEKASVLELMFMLSTEVLFGWRIATFVAVLMILTVLWHFVAVWCLENTYKHLNKKYLSRTSASTMSNPD